MEVDEMLFAPHISLEQRLAIVLGVLLASFLLVIAGFDKIVSSYLVSFGAAGAAVAGAFYTLGATTPFAMVVLLELMQHENAILVAAVACASAALVDCLLFSVVRDALERNAKKMLASTRRKFSAFSGAFPVAGFFVFGLPLPDELGLALMEMTKIELLKLAVVIFLAKFVTLLMLSAAIVR